MQVETAALGLETKKWLEQGEIKLQRLSERVKILEDESKRSTENMVTVKAESKLILEEIVEKWDSHSDLVHAKNLSQITSKLFEATECPISFELMKDPVLTPSGHTVDRKAMEELIYRGFRDPFTREGVWTSIIQNYALTEITKTVFSCWQELKLLNSQPK
jgi:peptidyl-tRNA hydrolase